MEGTLPIDEVGPWVHEKHDRLRRYITISSKVRAMFLEPGKAGASYVDLYCGHGSARIRDTQEVVDGSAIVAALAAQDSGHPFSEIHIGDTDEEAVRATSARLRAKGISANVFAYTGTAAETAKQVAARLDRHGLPFVFLDPYNLGDLPITVFEPFAPLSRTDVLVHVSAMDLQRNLGQAIDAAEGHQFDAFAPGWRTAVDLRQAPREVRRAIRRYWIQLVRNFGFQAFEEEQFTLVTGNQNQPLYWLALAAKHNKAAEFWEKIRHIEPQKGFTY